MRLVLENTSTFTNTVDYQGSGDSEWGDVTRELRKVTKDVLTNLLQSIGGRVVGDNRLEVLFNFKDDRARIVTITETNSLNSAIQATDPTNAATYTATFASKDSAALISFAAINTLKRMTVLGGDKYMLAAVQQTTATTLDVLGFQLSIAQGFGDVTGSL
jgi:hypothetical protein